MSYEQFFFVLFNHRKRRKRAGASKMFKYISTVYSYENNIILKYESSISFYQASMVVNLGGHPGNWPILVVQFVC